MSERRQQVTDDGTLHKYRTEIPNTIIRGVLGHGLSLPARWLYVYLKSVAGDEGECWQNMTTLAAGSQLSRGAVSKARHELVAAKLIAVIKGKGALHETDHIRIMDIWQQNMTEFWKAPSSSGERVPSSLSESEDSKESQETMPEQQDRVHHMNAPSSPGERASSPHEHPSSSGERLLKKIPEKKIPEKKENQPPTPLKGESTRARMKASQQPNTEYTPGFNLIWAAYPPFRKQGKVDTFAIWRERELEPRAREIAEKIARLAVTVWKGIEKHKVPMPTTWFNQSRYEDDLVPLEATEEDELRERTSPSQYRTIQALKRFGEKRNGPDRRPPVSGSDAEVIDGVQYRIE